MDKWTRNERFRAADGSRHRLFTVSETLSGIAVINRRDNTYRDFESHVVADEWIQEHRARSVRVVGQSKVHGPLSDPEDGFLPIEDESMMPDLGAVIGRPMDPNSAVGRARTALLAALAEHEEQDLIPTNGRFLYYELVHRNVFPKHAKKGTTDPDTIIGLALTELRKKGLVPWDWINDETRDIDDWAVYSSIKDSVIASVRYASLDPWAGLPPIIICESRSLRQALTDVAREFSVPITSSNGQCLAHLQVKVGPAMQRGQQVLYFGDLDRSGGDIENNSRTVLEEILRGPLLWERLALTQAQAAAYDLVAMSRYDERDKKYHDAIETEGLGQGVIVQILRDRLLELLPEPLAAIHKRE